MKYQTVKGFRDIFGKNVNHFATIEQTARDIFCKYNYQEIKIPTVEFSELFLRSIGETTDIVEKEMYVFEDKGNRIVALRPEGTAGVVRAFIENNLAQQFSTHKFFYIGQMFRQENPQSGRFREFSQVGCEYFGNSSVYADIEVIMLAKEIIETAGIKNIKIEVNSLGCKKCRPVFVETVKHSLQARFNDLCDDCKRRFYKNPLRVLDCKIDNAKFKDINPQLCDECKTELEQLKSGLKDAKVDFTVSDKLVRGLDYYTGIVFEIKINSDILGSQNAVCAGGRYNNLVEELGGQPTPAVGFAIGVDRIVEVLGSISPARPLASLPAVFVCATGNEESKKIAFSILSRIRDAKIIADGGYFTKSLKAQMRLADALKTKYVVIVGDEELKKRTVILRDMTTKQQQEILQEKIIEKLAKISTNNRREYMTNVI